MKTAPSSIRTIALTPPTMPSTKILELIREDIRIGTTTGYLGYNPSGDRIRVYLDLCGSLADFKEASDGLMTFNNQGTAGCNLCNFRKNNNKISRHSVNAYTSTSHSRNSAFTRTPWRHKMLFDTVISPAEANYIGMKMPHHVPTSFDTFLRLERDLQRAVSPTSLPHARFYYRAFPCSVIAPDHCIVLHRREYLQRP